ncbi:MAG: hypothetical protein Kow00108_15420 [Calditrichia bacterium]
MAAETQNFAEFLKNAETLYEAVMIIAQRGKEINQEKLQRLRELETFDESDLFLEEEETDEIVLPEEKLKEDKPLVYAQKEFLEGKLEYYYEQPKRRR